MSYDIKINAPHNYLLSSQISAKQVNHYVVAKKVMQEIKDTVKISEKAYELYNQMRKG